LHGHKERHKGIYRHSKGSDSGKEEEEIGKKIYKRGKGKYLDIGIDFELPNCKLRRATILNADGYVIDSVRTTQLPGSYPAHQ